MSPQLDSVKGLSIQPLQSPELLTAVITLHGYPNTDIQVSWPRVTHLPVHLCKLSI